MANPLPTPEMSREYMVQLMKSLAKIEKAIGNNDTAQVLRELLGKLSEITLAGKGDKGDDGYTPKKGTDYDDGKDGRSIVKVELNEKYELTVLFSDGKETNLGSIRGPEGPGPDHAAVVRDVLAGIQMPEVDLDALAAEAAQRVGAPPTVEQIVEAIKKDLAYTDLKDRPDLDELIKKHIGEFESQRERGVYTAPGAGSTLVILDEGVIVSQDVRSIDFRGSSVSVTDLGDGNLAATFTGGGGASIATEVVTGTQDGDDVNIAVAQLAHAPGEIQWVSRNGQILIPGTMDPAGISSWEEVGGDIVVYWADAGDSFQVSYTY